MENQEQLCIVFPSGTGGLCFTIPAPDADIHEVESSILPDAVPRTIIPVSALPASDFRDAWVFNLEVGAEISMENAREIHRNRIRDARKAEFEKLDIAFIKALETSDDTERNRVVSLKETLRNLTAAPEIENATDIQALRDFWPSELLGISPYSVGG